MHDPSALLVTLKLAAEFSELFLARLCVQSLLGSASFKLLLYTILTTSKTMHSRNSNLQGASVYVLHKAYVVDPEFAELSDVPKKLEKSTVGIYSSAKAARAALRACMADGLFQ
jgi:hypothetical protein